MHAEISVALEDTLLWQNLRARKGRAFHGGGSFGHSGSVTSPRATVGTGLASVVGKARGLGMVQCVGTFKEEGET